MAIKLDRRNYRKHDDKNKNLIKKSLEECGAGRSIVVDAEDEIIAGNGVFEQAKKLKIPVKVVETDGSELVVVKRTDMKSDDERRKRLAVMDNSTSDSSEFDFELLSVDFNLPDLQEMGIEMPDLEENEEIEIIEDEIPERAQTRCKKNDVWQLGEHRLMCGDSTDLDSVDRLMCGSFADLFITDPPYNVNYEGATKDRLKILNDNMKNDEFRSFLKKAFSAADAHMRAGAAFYIWHSDSEGEIFRGSCSDVGWKIRQCLIWNKNQIVLGRQDYQWKHEPCLYGWKDGRSHLWTNDRKQSTVLDCEKPKENKAHPTMKPVRLFDYLIKNNTKKSDLVLDLFAGSGTSIMACEQNRRKCFSMELDEHYCDVILQRWENFTGKKAILI